ncbi:MAG TPA: hypothetical protein PKY77_10540 [Phycisphaerae bacterium]|nr:hypothetical protein [Phycisphaerae bacterium]HRY70016.1 hypothetical protein [Phycisphaerae bacterium]HSA27225.1 hypothetical protein [Phycisphaerae bacterium]
MKSNVSRMLRVVAVFASAWAAHLHAAEIQGPFAETAGLSLELDLGGPAEWKLESSGSGEARYSGQGHALVLRLQEKGQRRLLRMTLTPPAGRKLSVRSYTAKVTMAQAGLHAVMVPNTRPIAHSLIYFHQHRTWPKDMRICRCLIPAGFEENARSNSEAPFILLTEKSGNNRLAVGWTAADRATSLKGAARGEQYVLSLSRRDDVPFTGDVLEDSLYISTESGPWLEVATDYAKAFDAANGRKHATAPEWATEPVFCTWYCYQDHIDQAGVLKIGRKCREMGFGTILIDAGWDCRPDGGYGDWEHGILGDFTAAPDRFPDLAGAIREMHEMGLKVELWSAPFWQGRQSKAYKERTRDFHAWTKDGEDHNLCPRCVGMREYLKETFAQVAKRYAMDGMWLDAADGVPPECTARHQHLEQPMGAAFVDCLTAIHDGLRSVNPQAVTEARVLHANIHSKRAMDVVQPSDAPESFEVLRLAGIQMRPWAYDVVLKNDPMFWKKDADAATVGKFLATMVCNGVPALSVDFLTAPDWQCRQTAAWLKFYQEHKQTLLRGEFRLFGADAGAPDMMLLGEREAVVYVRNADTRDVAMPRRLDRIILLNCTDADGLKLTLTPGDKPKVVRIYGPDWTRVESAAAGENSKSPSVYPVPQGGAAMIKVTWPDS